MARFLLVLLVLLCPAAACAQEAQDKGYLTNLLQESLGGEGRTVSIDGFAGAFSSRATIDAITIADREGVWLRLEEVVVDWNRSALLRGRIDVEELSAKRIDLPRLPLPPETELPAAEAQGFALPDLPVAIEVGLLQADEITLGAPVLGEEASLSLRASASLAGGGATVTLEADRVDGKAGRLDLDAAFDGTTVTLDLALSEGEAGIAARLLQLPGMPPVQLNITGDGPLDDLTSNLRLATDGEERLAGDITLAAEPATGPGIAPARRFSADIGGDVTALFAPQYRPFFGDDIDLVVAGIRSGDGALTLEQLDLKAQSVSLQGAVSLNRDNWPVLLDISGQIGAAGGDPVLLPLSGAETRIDNATVSVRYDRDSGDDWTAAVDVEGLARDGLQVQRVVLDGGGTLVGEVNAIGQIAADLMLDIAGIALDDPALQEALGSRLTGALGIDFVEDQPIRLRDLDLAGADYSLAGEAEISGLEDGLNTAFDLMLRAEDLSRFSALAGQPLTGEAALSLAGEADAGGSFDVGISGDASGLTTGIAEADAMLAGRTTLALAAERDMTGTRLQGLDLRNDQLSFTGNAELATGAADIRFKARLNDAALVLDTLEGPLTVEGRALQDTLGWNVDVDAAGPFGAQASIAGLATGPQAAIDFDASLPDIQPFVPQYTGAARLVGRANQSPLGWQLRTDVTGPYGLKADVVGRVTGQNAPDIRFDARLPNVKPFVPQLDGPLRLVGEAQQVGDTINFDTDAEGPYGLTATAKGALKGADLDATLTARLPDINPLVPQYRGAVELNATARKRADQIDLETDLAGPYGLEADVTAMVAGENIDATYDARLPNVRPLAPQFNGSLAVAGTARMRGELVSIDADLDGPYGLTAQVSGDVAGTAPAFTVSARLPDVAPLVPNFSGPLSVDGTARQQGANWFVDTAIGGPAGTTADIVGRVGTDGRLGLSVAGNAPLALANPFLAPRSIQGQTRFDLRVDGPPELGSVSGQITASDGRLTAPNFRVALENIAANIALNAGRANLDVAAALSSGGQLQVQGPVTLSGGFPANLAIDLNNLQITDPALYETILNGQIAVAGNLTGGARIGGQIDVGETNVTVPSSGLGGFAIVPEIVHVGDSAAARTTRSRAGLDPKGVGSSDDEAGPAYPLDLLVSAPARVFVRGRGLDAELGGSLRLTGTTANIISAGQFELIRGRLDILEQRFTLDEGRVQLQGNFDPFLRFVATTNTSVGTASVIIEGPASEPEVRFESSPPAPQDEVLAQIFFGRDVSELSAFQALQLANAVASLAGSGGEGIVSRLRRSFALDDLDVTTDNEGNTAVRAGKYISDNVYTDVEVGGADGPEVSINIDLTPNLTARGTANTVGQTSIGIYYEKDY